MRMLPKKPKGPAKRAILLRHTALMGTLVTELAKKGALIKRNISYTRGETSEVKPLSWDDLKKIAALGTVSVG